VECSPDIIFREMVALKFSVSILSQEVNSIGVSAQDLRPGKRFRPAASSIERAVRVNRRVLLAGIVFLFAWAARLD